MTDRIRIEPDSAPADRYHRQSLIGWWDQDRIRAARVLVIGAGALGNEILKLLALTGVGEVLVYDLDIIERSNLSRSVLFRDGDEGRPKAETAAARAGELDPAIRIRGVTANLLHHAGLGLFDWADVVIGGVDNREARIFASAACARVGRPYIDGAIEGLSGIVRGFEPARGACYACTMNSTDWRIVDARRSCAMLARRAADAGHVPNTAVAASIVAALEVQEALKRLHGQPALSGEGIHIDGMWGVFDRVRYPRRDDCVGHDRLPPLEPLGCGTADVTLDELLARAEQTLGTGAVLDLSRDVVTRLECVGCGHVEAVGCALGAVEESDAACPECGAHRAVEFTSSVARGDTTDTSRTPADIGIPPFDVIVARQGLETRRAWLFDGDAVRVLAPLTPRPPADRRED